MGRDDDVAGYEVVEGWTEGEEGVYAGWTVLMETEIMEVGIVGETTEAMGSLSGVLVSCQDWMWGILVIERGVLGCLDGGGCRIELHLGDVPYVNHRSSNSVLCRLYCCRSVDVGVD